MPGILMGGVSVRRGVIGNTDGVPRIERHRATFCPYQLPHKLSLHKEVPYLYER